MLLISGNHDSAERLTVGARLMEKSRVYMAPVYTGALQQITLQDQFGPVTFTLLPFLRPAVVRAAWPDETVESTSDAVRVALSHCPPDEPGGGRCFYATSLCRGLLPAIRKKSTLAAWKRWKPICFSRLIMWRWAICTTPKRWGGKPCGIAVRR